jgi:general secretion pathway protein G
MKTQTHNVSYQKRKLVRAFTLVEMLLVVTIIGVLAALVIPRIVGVSDKARITATRGDIDGGIKTALGRYEVDVGSYPKSLEDLVMQPSNSKRWQGPYLDKLPNDQWGHPYIYAYPGKHSNGSYDLSSAGPDEKEGTEDDITSWAVN